MRFTADLDFWDWVDWVLFKKLSSHAQIRPQEAEKQLRKVNWWWWYADNQTLIQLLHLAWDGAWSLQSLVNFSRVLFFVLFPWWFVPWMILNDCLVLFDFGLWWLVGERGQIVGDWIWYKLSEAYYPPSSHHPVTLPSPPACHYPHPTPPWERLLSAKLQILFHFSNFLYLINWSDLIDNYIERSVFLHSEIFWSKQLPKV